MGKTGIVFNQQYMYSLPQLALRYLQYRLRASNGRGHGMHSPFVFDFITRVLNDRSRYPAFKDIEALRHQLKQDRQVIRVEDFGAGSVYRAEQKRSIGSIARNAAKPAKYGQLLHRMVKYYQPSTILELGTSLGITSAYLAMAAPGARLVTMEGAHEIASRARANFSNLGLKNVEVIEGNFEVTLPAFLETTGIIDFAFIDGNHRKEPTLRYFEQLLTHHGNESIFIFDDIHWSEEMEEAWKVIREHPSVQCSIDLFFIGIVVFRKEFREKQQFEIRF
jgi:predicted O-methyltransferase YrrM